MTIPIRERAHLVERAIEAFGSPAQAPAQPSPQPPAHEERKPTAITVEMLVNAGLCALPAAKPRSRLLEEMMVVQQQVARCMEQCEPSKSHIIVVTSARPAEGKTFISLNLAACMAVASGMKVVLVDADGKNGSISHALGQTDARGLRTLPLQSTAPSIMLDTDIPNLAFLPHGHGEAEDVRSSSGANVAAALSRLSRTYPDHVFIVDTPPSLSTSDANAMSAVAGQVIMVVNAEHTQKSEVEAALDMMDACQNLQLLLNNVSLTANDSFGAYGHYGVTHAD